MDPKNVRVNLDVHFTWIAIIKWLSLVIFQLEMLVVSWYYCYYSRLKLNLNWAYLNFEVVFNILNQVEITQLFIIQFADTRRGIWKRTVVQEGFYPDWYLLKKTVQEEIYFLMRVWFLPQRKVCDRNCRKMNLFIPSKE